MESSLFEDLSRNIGKIIAVGKECKRISNRNPLFTRLWRDCYAPPEHIGHNNTLFDIYGIDVSSDYTKELHRFIFRYVSDRDPSFNSVTIKGSKAHGRDIGQLREIADRISNDCIRKHIALDNGLDKDIEKLVCLIIYHACVETFNGMFNEKIVEEHFKSYGFVRGNQTPYSDSIWDRNGVDIILYKDGKIIWFVQVKPVSFMIGDKPDLIRDREKCLSINQRFVDKYISEHSEEIHRNADRKILYTFYANDGEFLNFKNRNDDDGVFVHFVDFSNRDGSRIYTPVTVKSLPNVMLTKFKKN